MLNICSDNISIYHEDFISKNIKDYLQIVEYTFNSELSPGFLLTKFI